MRYSANLLQCKDTPERGCLHSCKIWRLGTPPGVPRFQSGNRHCNVLNVGLVDGEAYGIYQVGTEYYGWHLICHVVERFRSAPSIFVRRRIVRSYCGSSQQSNTQGDFYHINHMKSM